MLQIVMLLFLREEIKVACISFAFFKCHPPKGAAAFRQTLEYANREGEWQPFLERGSQRWWDHRTHPIGPCESLARPSLFLISLWVVVAVHQSRKP